MYLACVLNAFCICTCRILSVVSARYHAHSTTIPHQLVVYKVRSNGCHSLGRYPRMKSEETMFEHTPNDTQPNNSTVCPFFSIAFGAFESLIFIPVHIRFDTINFVFYVISDAIDYSPLLIARGNSKPNMKGFRGEWKHTTIQAMSSHVTIKNARAREIEKEVLCDLCRWAQEATAWKTRAHRAIWDYPRRSRRWRRRKACNQTSIDSNKYVKLRRQITSTTHHTHS